MNYRQQFGAFIRAKRSGHEITVRAMAAKLGVQVGYYCDIESGRRSPIDYEFLDKIADALVISEAERQTFFDLAGKAREAAPPDLTGYINDTPKARVALRVAKEKATDADWERFIYYLKGKGEQDT